MGAVSKMKNKIAINNVYGMPKNQFERELENLNHQIRMIEQKLVINVDRKVLSYYQGLEDKITYTRHSFGHIKKQVDCVHYDEWLNPISVKDKSALV